MTIFEALREDHDKQRELLKQLTATSGESKERKEIFKKLKHELEIHANAEERYFFVPLLEEDITQEKARHCIAEHHEIDELIEKLEETEMSSTGWLTIAKSLAEKVEHHLDEEEHEVFQVAGKALTKKSKTDLTKEYQTYMESERK